MVGSDALMRLSLVISMSPFSFFLQRDIEIHADEDAFAVQIEIAYG